MGKPQNQLVELRALIVIEDDHVTEALALLTHVVKISADLRLFDEKRPTDVTFLTTIL